MCGRYDLVVTGGMLAARFGVSSDEVGEDLAGGDWQPRYNIAPSQLNPVVVTSDDQGKHPGRRLARMKWGLVPGWSKEPKTSFSTINARAETVTRKPAFRKLLSSRRCLVPATGYFEWAVAEGKQPYRVQVTAGRNSLEDEIVAMAGLYDVWRGPEGQDGEALLTYTIITTEATPSLRGLHERMPVILSREGEGVWLDPSVKDAGWLVGLLRPYRPYPNEKIGAYRVGGDVNSPRNDRPQVIEAYEQLAVPIRM